MDNKNIKLHKLSYYSSFERWYNTIVLGDGRPAAHSWSEMVTISFDS